MPFSFPDVSLDTRGTPSSSYPQVQLRRYVQSTYLIQSHMHVHVHVHVHACVHECETT